jgi:integrase
VLKLVKRPKSANWYIRGTLRGQVVEESTGVVDKKVAEEILAKRQTEILTESIWGKTLTITFAHALSDYIEHGGGEKRFLRPLLDHFQLTLLRDIDLHSIDLAAKKLYPDAGPATRNRQVYTPLSAILHHAARKGWCPTPIIERPKQPKGVIRWLKPNEADRLIDACAPHLRPLVVFMLYTGARAGEALWLEWCDVDLTKKQVTFRRTKNGEPRSVPLHPRVMEALSEVEHRESEVFRTPSGEEYARPRGDADTSAGSRIRSAFLGACRRAGIVDFRVHDCRHTWATWHYQANRDLTALQKLGGWKTPSMVLRYAHANVEEHASSIDSLPWGKSGEFPKVKVVNNE